MGLGLIGLRGPSSTGFQKLLNGPEGLSCNISMCICVTYIYIYRERVRDVQAEREEREREIKHHADICRQLYTNLNTCMHACMHACMHTYIHCKKMPLTTEDFKCMGRS